MEKIKKNMSCSGQDCFENDHFNFVLRKGEISHLSYLGLSVEQNPNIVYPFYKLISQIKPKQILEIGTFAGGLTLILRDLLDENGLEDSQLTTYDVNSPNYLIEQVGNKKIKIEVKNLFSDDYQSFRSDKEMNEISSFIQQEGRTIVLCDGGSKKSEFNIIAPFLKEGDIIMAHDYCYDESTFENKIKGRYWNWLEIKNSDIEQSCLENSLEDYLEDDFDKVAWVCKIKRK